MPFRILISLLALILMGNALAAPLNVVATNSSLGALVRALAGERLEPTVLVGPEHDLHQIQAKPSMMRALRDANLVVAIGAELEVGWLPAAIAGAANPAIQPGRDGYFEAAAQVELLDVGKAADRALGDVHPLGNPHVDLDPVRMVQIAAALAERLARLDPDGAAIYRQGAAVFAQAVEQRVADWRARLAGAPGVLLYHRDAVYLLDRFGVPLLGTIESTPGVPPTGQDLLELTTKLKGRAGVVIYAPYQSPQVPTKLARDLGWPVKRLPLAPPLEADGTGYLDHIEHWVEAIAAARP
ncbi:metal ABC transporter substrate-binding protein [Thermochromatium tepidum]|uniref:Zinc ABC transporter substrate-binding protein n=1 Tax=Thermochromatium tepidum ATCC 43061 TaxID=316276 RepID=A0A6I6EEB2_THETI|nr:metal ABC transporter substrate-binding protein [Thermochromatium tepidum]QGU31727.1 zinc ABC transporter substrate-binding protein [Thermochromatium tepidum ATCC 43061]